MRPKRTRELSETDATSLIVNLPYPTTKKQLTIEGLPSFAKIYYIGNRTLDLPTLTLAEFEKTPIRRFKRCLLAIDQQHSIDFLKKYTKLIPKLYAKPAVVTASMTALQIRNRLQSAANIKVTCKRTFSLKISDRMASEACIKHAVDTLTASLQQQGIDMRRAVLYIKGTQTKAVRL